VKRVSGSMLCSLICAVAALLLALAPSPVRADSDVALVVIVSPSSKLTNLRSDELRRLFQSEGVTAPDGQRLIALNHPPKTADRVGFDQAVLGKDATAVGRFWIDRKVRGGGAPPRTVESLATLRRVVEKLPGAVGYMRPAQLSDEVRAIRVDGKLPEDPGYLVRYRP
jgi:hypothetical protein